jgi:cellulose synthase/poly-beta-1,6-N-acetylglucosamine synthase-like glycosyltransferase
MLTLVHIVVICIFLSVYVWSLYNLPILAAGVKNLRRNRGRVNKRRSKKTALPSFSIIVPVKDEEKVIERLLTALSRVRYPADKMEIIIVEDGSTDKSFDVCREYAERSSLNMKVLRKPVSDGKPSALNFGINHAKGEIIGVFDADNVPAPDTLLNVCKYFDDPRVAAVQGRTLSINSEENMLTKFLSYEEAVWCEAYLRGKDVLGLFVHLRGSCQFLRRETLEKLNGFDEKALSEDMELSARLTEKGYRIRYAPDVRAWQENPSSFKELFKQRIRWFRGTMMVAFKYGRLLTRPSKETVDAETTLIAPFILIISLITYFAAFFSFFLSTPFAHIWHFLMQLAIAITSGTLLLCGFALIYASKPRSFKSLLWVPFIYLYWSMQAFIALYALLLTLLKRPIKWEKTAKNGVATIPAQEFLLSSADLNAS